jgi:hypothetical protein
MLLLSFSRVHPIFVACALALSSSPALAGGGAGEGGSGGGAPATLDRDGDGFTPAEGDCDDDDPTVSPAAVEKCNGKDDNCDGLVDEGYTGYVDHDGDGYGDSATARHGCPAREESGERWVTRGGDCNDTDPGTLGGPCPQDPPELDAGFGVVPNAVSGALLFVWLGVGAWRRRRTRGC